MKFSNFLVGFSRVFFGYAILCSSSAQEGIKKNISTDPTHAVETQGQAYSVPERVVPSISRITFYRPVTASGSGVQTVKVNGRYLTSLQAGGYVDLCLTPTHLEVRAYPVETGRQPTTHYVQAVTDLELGKDTYVRVTAPTDPQSAIATVESALALKELKDTRRQIHTLSRVSGVVPCEISETAQAVTETAFVKSGETILAQAARVPAAQGTQVKEIIRLDADNYFEFSKSEMSGMLPQSRQVLNRAIDRMKSKLAQSATGRINVLGYSDALGSAERKKILASNRAQAIASYMVSRGIPVEKITNEGRADADLVVTHCNTRISKEAIACNKPNRRVVIQFLDAN
jgi:OOP family OmpA-OmpF porin